MHHDLQAASAFLAGFCSNPGKQSVSSYIKDSPTSVWDICFLTKSYKEPEQNMLWNSKHSQNQRRFQLLPSLPVLSGMQYISCHPVGSLWMLLQQNELIALANENQNQKSTPNILTYTELHWSVPPTVSSTNEGVLDIKISHVTWTAGVFHP